jgi:soluble lytic murein transglycosylase
MRLNRRKYAAQLQEIWLRWPATRAAREARQLLDSLRERGVRSKTPSLDSRILQIRSLRRAKQYDEALKELARLRRKRRLSAEQLQQLDLERIKVHLKNGRPSAALPLLQELHNHKSSSQSATIRLMLADCLARLGRVEEGKKVALSGPQKGREAKRVYLGQTARLLKRYGRYAEALKIYREQDAHLPKKSRDRIMLGRAWLAYRAGEHDLAIKGFRHLRKHSHRERRYSLYWEARSEARAGRPDNALALYQQLVERHLRTYYGLLARSRLVEAGKLKLTAASCSPSTQPTSKDSARDPMVLEILDRLITRHDNLYPSLRRVRTLWQLGMMEDFLRELHLIGMDYAWVRAGGRVKWDDRRRAAERFWRGGPPIHRRWSRRDRAIIKERATIGPDLGELMARAGIFYYGWRYRPEEPDPVRKKFPRGYADLVLRLARKHHMDPNLVWAVMRTESAFRTDAISKADARGLMQVMPKTARRIAQEMELQEFHVNQLFDPEVSLKMAVWYLKALMGKFKGNIPLVAAGYNGGPHNVSLWLDQRGHRADLDEFIEEIPFSESRRYAKKILRLVALYERVYCGKDDRVVPNELDPSYGEFPSF